jgi:Flp pilus assembly protein TadG
MMLRHLRARFRDERGVTLIEVGLAGLLTAALGLMAVGWLNAGARSQEYSQGQNTALGDIRVVRQELLRELRFARSVTSGSASSMTFWVDNDRDAVVDTGETITWAITTGGTLTRKVDSQTAVVRARSLVYASSSFTYAPSAPPSATKVTIQLTVAPGGQLSQNVGLQVATDSVTLRNG